MLTRKDYVDNLLQGAGIPEAPTDGQLYARRGSDHSWQHSSGPVGPQGPQGPPGDPGAMGPAGPIGPTGPKGDTGATGAAGATGAQGPQGPQGNPGATGSTGPQGATGAQGVKGDKGDTGATGAAGATGAQGPIGNTGPQGPTGATGAQGPAGLDVGPPSQTRLLYWSTTQLALYPYNGSKIKTRAGLLDIGGGIISTATGVYVNGVAGQNLAASTTYLVCVFSNAGTPTLDFRTALAHSPDTASTNMGVEVANDDPSRTVVGMIRYAGQFNDNLIISWFNRRPKTFSGLANAGPVAIAGGSTTVLCTVAFCTWGSDAVKNDMIMSVYTDVVGNVFYLIHQLDGAASGLTYNTTAQTPAAANPSWMPLSLARSYNFAEGYHFTNIGLYLNAAANIYYYADNNVTIMG